MSDYTIAKLDLAGLGGVWVARNGRGITHIVLKGGRKAILEQLPTGTAVAEDSKAFAGLKGGLERYAAGEKVSFDETLAPSGTEFQRRVWRAIASIPWGETRSYAWLAAKAGRPTAVRAAAGACGANPIPIVIPCHRVIASDGTIGGFSGGLALKRKLLRYEGICL